MMRNFIGGHWVGAASGRVRERRNPAEEREVVATAPDSGRADVEQAVAEVSRGYRKWADTAPDVRADVLAKAAQLLADDADDIARQLVREEGKTLAEASVEARRTPANLRFYAGEALRMTGQSFPSSDGSTVLTLREPVGVVAAITPWNFPLNIPSRKLGPALAAGNGVVFKPSELTPLTAQRLVEALLAAGVPAGALALVHGGAEVGEALSDDRRVDALTFTGSTAVGEAIHRAGRASRRTQLEMGGKNPMIVLEDADLDLAARLVVQGAFGLSGQACTGTSRLVVHAAVHDELVDRVADAARRQVVGNGLRPGVTMGPLANTAQVDKVRKYVDQARDAGALVMAGSEPLPNNCDSGNFVRPHVLTEVDPESPLAQDEVFGPVLAVQRVCDFAEAIQVANSTQYGLSAGIVTRDIARALEFARKVDSGVLKVNLPTTGVAMTAPFGGVRNSSTQTFKEQAGDTMLHFYTVDKTVYLSA